MTEKGAGKQGGNPTPSGGNFKKDLISTNVNQVIRFCDSSLASDVPASPVIELSILLAKYTSAFYMQDVGQAVGMFLARTVMAALAARLMPRGGSSG